MTTLAHLLQANRRRFFVGRQHERDQFHHWLEHPAAAPRVVFIHGPGGIGKSTLLGLLQTELAAHDLTAVVLDARQLPTTPDALQHSLQQAIDRGRERLDPMQPLWLCIDAFEHLGALQGWFYETWLPQQAATVHWLLAGRQPPAPAWRSDPAWQGLLVEWQLTALPAPACADYLRQRGLPKKAAQQVVDFAQGYPLALAMAADLIQADEGLDLSQHSREQLMQNLALQFIREARTPSHASALQALALCHRFSEAMLAAMLPEEDSLQLYNWLAELSFVSADGQGLSLHELIAEILATDVRQRDPDKAERLITRGEDYLLHRLYGDHPIAASTFVTELTFLARQGEASDQFHRASQRQPLYPDQPRDDELAWALARLRHFQGDDAANWFNAWHQQQPQGLRIFRDQEHRAVGLLQLLRLNAGDTPVADPVLIQLQQVLRERGIDSQAPIDVGRFWLDYDHHLGISSTQYLALNLLVASAIETPTLAVSAIVMADNDMTRGIALAADHHCLDLGEGRLLVWHDWRDERVGDWLVRTNRRVRGLRAQPPPAATAPAPLPLPPLREALKKLLRHFHHNTIFAQSPLCHSPLCPANLSPEEQVHQLREQILDAAEALRAAPKNARYYDILWHSYFHPAKSRLDAAHALNMAPSTYYRHLATAVELLANELHRRQQTESF